MAGAGPGREKVQVERAESDGPWYTVIGVVGDMRRQGLEREALPQMFVSLAQNPASRNVDLFIRTSSNDPLAWPARFEPP